MRIKPVIYNIFSAKSDYKNNQYDYSQYRVPVLGDTYSFTGITQKVYSSNGRNAVTSLAGMGVKCLCCGKKMIDPSEISKMDKEGIFRGNSKDILENLKRFEKYMKPLEKRVYKLLCKLQQEYPQKSLPKLLETQKYAIEEKLINKQSKIFGKIYDYTINNLPKSKQAELGDILQSAYDEIYGRKPNTTFGRKKFIGLIYKLTKDIKSKDRAKLLEIADSLPTSQDQIEAFIIKYSRKNNRTIALRLIEKSVGTIEHIKPKAEGGPDNVFNYALECAEDNWARGSSPMIEQIRKNPSMPENAQKQVNQIIRLVNNGQSSLNATYVEKLKEALYRASGGVIDLNISRLKKNLPPKEIY